jgi:hypothetical protein
MTTVDFTFSFDQLAISMNDFREIAPEESKGLEPFQAVFEEILSRGQEIIQAAGGYCLIDDIAWEKDRIRLMDTWLNTGPVIAKPLRHASQMAVFACTAGPGVREIYDEYMAQNDLLHAFLVDTLGTVAVEKAMDLIQAFLSRETERTGLHISNRYSPGYCGWPVSEQKKLWQFLPPHYCGIELSESSLMTPIKSVSGIIGLGKNMRHTGYACALCDMEHCLYRRNKLASLNA